MTEITIYPRKFDKEQGDKVRALRVAACIRHLLATARLQLQHDVDWFRLDLAEVEAAMEAWENGGQHGFFTLWEQRRGEMGSNRPAPTATELQARRMIVLLCVALERGGFNRRAARRFAAKELASAGVFDHPPSHRTIEYWQFDAAPQLTPREEQFVATAIASCGIGNSHRLAVYFIGLAHLVHNAAPQIEFSR